MAGCDYGLIIYEIKDDKYKKLDRSTVNILGSDYDFYKYSVVKVKDSNYDYYEDYDDSLFKKILDVEYIGDENYKRRVLDVSDFFEINKEKGYAKDKALTSNIIKLNIYLSEEKKRFKILVGYDVDVEYCYFKETKDIISKFKREVEFLNEKR